MKEFKTDVFTGGANDSLVTLGVVRDRSKFQHKFQ
jgi:hypothetical protein